MCTAAAPPHLTLAPLVCLSHTHVQFSPSRAVLSLRRSTNANVPTSCGGPDLSRDPVYGGRLRAGEPAYGFAASRGAPGRTERAKRKRDKRSHRLARKSAVPGGTPL